MRLGRISYANMAPVFYKVEADVEEVTGVPTELNRMLLDGELDIAPISSIEYARNATRLRILPRLCVSSEGAVDSIQLVTRMQFNQVRTGRGDSRERDLGGAHPHPAAEGRDPAARDGGGREAPHR
jgi:predicted solute-binding protein